MREIKFRGQTRKLGEKVNLKGEPVPGNWVYGGIFQGVERSVIYDSETYEKHSVYNETVGQYTNFKDKHGTEIYEGDIIRIYNDELDESDSWIDDVSYHMGGFFSGDEDLLGNVHFRAKVIGNIHDNPELLGEVN